MVLDIAETEESVEILEPSARPSNIWWNITTIARFQNSESPATTVVTPITGHVLIYGMRRFEKRVEGDIQIEWKIIPASITHTLNLSSPSAISCLCAPWNTNGGDC